MAAGCSGGGDNPATPPKVTSVTVTLGQPQVEVGLTTFANAQYFDGKGTALSGRAVTYVSSAPAVATVDNNGTVIGVTTGSATITATVEGVSGSASLSVLQAAVATVVIEQRVPVVKELESITLTAITLDRIGQGLTGRALTWSSANPTRATVSNAGVVSGVSAGSTYIRAESEGKIDSVLLKVKSLNAPSISGGAPALLVPGNAATITGLNFGITPNDNEVYVNGIRATVTASSATNLTFTVPSAAVLPCVPNDASIPLLVVANADSAFSSRQLRIAATKSLAVGEAAILNDPADLTCTEYVGTGGKYLITAFNYANTPQTKVSFELLGASNSLATVSSAQTAAAAAVAPSTVNSAPMPGATFQQIPPYLQRHLANHLSLMEREAKITASRRPAREIWRTQRARSAREQFRIAAPSGPKDPPALNSTSSFRMCPESGTSISFCDQFQEVSARAVYVGPKMIIYEDVLAPTAGQNDAVYQKIGAEFDRDMYPILLSFGRPLAADTDLQWTGKITALFTRRVNQYRGGGILGFVTACDFFPRTDPDPNAACPSSNEGPYFYAIVPDPNNSNANQQISAATWERYVRGTLIHEAKHITAVSERYVHDASRAFDEAWVEEATAQEASEIWSRLVYGKPAMSDITWADGPQCDYAQLSGTCTDPVEAILHHFNFLYLHYQSNETKSIISDPSSPIPDPVIYGSSWSFMRYVTDRQPNEGDFLRSITMVKDDAGVQNIVDHSGHPFWELMGGFSLASLADNYPSATINDARIKLVSWNTRDIFQGMSQFLVTGNPPRQAFPRVFPMNIRAVSYGNFSGLQQQVTNLPGGGWIAWELSGAQSAPQVLSIRTPTGGPPPANIGLAIVRIQ
ncbi:MAG: Ig-like domain-containing protein [Gemmatimonadaceae bacterium]